MVGLTIEGVYHRCRISLDSGEIGVVNPDIAGADDDDHVAFEQMVYRLSF